METKCPQCGRVNKINKALYYFSLFIAFISGSFDSTIFLKKTSLSQIWRFIEGISVKNAKESIPLKII